MNRLKLALTHARRGAAIFPCHSIREGRCSCRYDAHGNVNEEPCQEGDGKHPRWHVRDLRNGSNNATTDEVVIKKWWTRWPDANVGIATGAKYGFVVVDVDVAEGKRGSDSFDKYLSEWRNVKTYAVRTGSGGIHYYFATDQEIRSRQHLFERGSGIDLKADGGYVVAPGSNHKSGNPYKIMMDVPLLPLSLTQAEKLRNANSYAVEQGVTEADWTRTVKDGEGRHNHLVRLAGKLIRSNLPYDAIWDSLSSYNDQHIIPPKTPAQLDQIITSLLRGHAERSVNGRGEKSFRVDMGDYVDTEEDIDAKLEENAKEASAPIPPLPPLPPIPPPEDIYIETLAEEPAPRRESVTKPVKKPEVLADVKESAKTEDAEKARKRAPFEITWLQAAELFGDREVEWVIDEWLPRNTLGFAVAPPGTRKTWLLIDLALSVATGRDFLANPMFKTRYQGNVLFINQEDPYEMLFRRFCDVMNVARPEVLSRRKGDLRVRMPMPDYPNPPIYWHVGHELFIKDRDSVHRLEEVIRRRKIDLVIIDPLYSMLELKDYGAESAREMLVFKAMRDLYGCSFMIAHHTKKGEENGARLRDFGWGSQFLNAFVETGWQIRPRAQRGSVRVQRHFKMADEVAMANLTFNISPWDYRVDYELVEAEDTSKMDALAELLGAEQVTSYARIKEELGLTGNGSVQDLLKRAGAVKLDGHYQILDDDALQPKTIPKRRKGRRPKKSFEAELLEGADAALSVKSKRGRPPLRVVKGEGEESGAEL